MPRSLRLTYAFIPESAISNVLANSELANGRSSDSLRFLRPSHPARAEQWLEVATTFV